jgi:hypothetical protein
MSKHAPPDAFGESDGSYFAARPEARVRRRLPFPSELAELAPELSQTGAGREIFIEVTMARTAAGQLARVRALHFVAGGVA